MSWQNRGLLTWLFVASPALAVAAEGAAPAPRVWAVVAGVGAYQDPAIPRRERAVLDARDVRSWLIDTAGWRGRDILFLYDSGAATHVAAKDQVTDLAPTRENLSWAMRDWLAARARPGDTVLLYFSGQMAARPPARDDPAGATAREALLPIDARAGRADETAWALEDDLDHLAEEGKYTVVCWLDVTVQRPTAPAPDAAPEEPDAALTRFLNRLARWPKVSVWLTTAEAGSKGEAHPFPAAVARAMGGPGRPNNLLAGLDRLHHDPALPARGFRVRGGVAPDVTLWSQRVRARGAADRELLLQRGHGDRVMRVEPSSDGAQLVTAGMDSSVRFWRVADQALLGTLPDRFHVAGVTALAASPDGRLVLSGDGSGRVRAWDRTARAEVRFRSPPPHAGRVVALGFLPGGSHFVSADKDGRCALWDASGSEIVGGPLAGVFGAVAFAATEGPAAAALAGDDGRVTLLGADGKAVKTLPAGDALVTALDLAPDGRLLAVGDDDGAVTVRDTGTGGPVFRHALKAPVSLVRLSAARLVAFAAGEALHLAALDGGGKVTPLDAPGRAAQAVFSADGRSLAVCTRDGGAVHAWRLDDPARPEPVPLAGARGGTPAVSLAVTPDGRTLVSGDQDGGIRAWALPGGERAYRIGPRRGKVAGLSASADRRYLLQVTRDGVAEVWDLQEGRRLNTVAGRWTSGAITPDGEDLLLTRETDGDVVRLGRASGAVRSARFARPAARGGPGPVTWRFGATTPADGDQMLAVSPDGRLAAACSSEGPLACVWEAATGRLRQVVRDPQHTERLSAVAFSADSKTLLTADWSGAARLWDLTGAGEVPREIGRAATERGEAITAARISPTEPGKIVLGTAAGEVGLWDAARGRRLATLARLEAGQVRSLAFSPDGRRVAVGGGDKSLSLAAVGGPPGAAAVDPRNQHGEAVNSVLVWEDDGRAGGGAGAGAGVAANAPVVVSGSDDTTVRFWDLTRRRLLGTLSAVQPVADPAAGAPGAAAGAPAADGLLEASWVAYTPDGLFDSSPGGERQVTWARDGTVMPLEQFYETAFVANLSESLRRGSPPQPPAGAPLVTTPPSLTIDEPARRTRKGEDRRVELTISLGGDDVRGLRLYRNGIPVLDETDEPAAPGRRRVRAALTLLPGANKVYAMAGRPGAADGRSNEVTIHYEGPGRPGQLHVLALGVSEYQYRALRFAHDDARSIAAFLRDHGVRGADQKGLTFVLTDRQVTGPEVEAKFRLLRERVKDRPGDTVVLFLAGHTGVLNDRFSLLLPPYPFPPGPRVVAMRGFEEAAPAVGPREGIALPYATIYRNLSQLGALQRLIIVDACQAEAIFDDRGVKLIQRKVDDAAHRCRVDYILAARRGEPATEDPALRHGLLTYALLRGMGDRSLEPAAGAKVFDREPSADLDRDGVITASELRTYADRVLPDLAAQFPATRSEERSRSGLPPSAGPAPSQGLRMQSTGSRTFPLIAVPETLPTNPG